MKDIIIQENQTALPGYTARRQVRFHEVSGNQSFEEAVVSSASNVNVDQSSLRDGFGFSCSSVVDPRVQVQSSGPWSDSQVELRLIADSQAELRLIADSSWASQVEKGELVNAEVAQRALTVERRLASLKSGCWAPSIVSMINVHFRNYMSAFIVTGLELGGLVMGIGTHLSFMPLSNVENTFLTSVPSADDIHDTVFAMDDASTLRPDGFSGSFYQRCWDVVGSDVVLAVQDFFITGVIFPGLNSNFIILDDRLVRVVARIISPQQFGFIRDRHIEDCIALASKCVNVLQKKCYRGNLAMKIDIYKAFDTLDWFFLCRVLQAFGFSFIFMDWIDDILRSSRLSVLLNVVPEGYFCCSRGVHQGDPLSPFLFDDILIFCRGTQKNLKHIMGAFGDYGDISG
ncbi:hypothetical protein LWI28_019868 [Acer negundo]|uniref:Reverse transcriptase domain-containing protein n=1 Tax=Acer negundo TaxID=4023 RepID=A0AAD5IBB5_ACENE|nr:hypothetical protein LWI28_019868 [Acer negundo]